MVYKREKKKLKSNKTEPENRKVYEKDIVGIRFGSSLLDEF